MAAIPQETVTGDTVGSCRRCVHVGGVVVDLAKFKGRALLNTTEVPRTAEYVRYRQSPLNVGVAVPFRKEQGCVTTTAHLKQQPTLHVRGQHFDLIEMAAKADWKTVGISACGSGRVLFRSLVPSCPQF